MNLVLVNFIGDFGLCAKLNIHTSIIICAAKFSNHTNWHNAQNIYNNIMYMYTSLPVVSFCKETHPHLTF